MAEPFPCWGVWAFRRSLQTALAPKDVKQCILYLWYFIVIRVRWKEAEIYRYLCQRCSDSQRNPSKSGCEFHGSVVAPGRSQTALINCLRHKFVCGGKKEDRWAMTMPFFHTEISPDCVTGNLSHTMNRTLFILSPGILSISVFQRGAVCSKMTGQEWDGQAWAIMGDKIISSTFPL